MTPEERAAKIVTQWQQDYTYSGFQSVFVLEDKIAAAITEAVMSERETCAAIADEYTRDGIAAAAIRARNQE